MPFADASPAFIAFAQTRARVLRITHAFHIILGVCAGIAALAADLPVWVVLMLTLVPAVPSALGLYVQRKGAIMQSVRLSAYSALAYFVAMHPFVSSVTLISAGWAITIACSAALLLPRRESGLYLLAVGAVFLFFTAREMNGYPGGPFHAPGWTMLAVQGALIANLVGVAGALAASWHSVMRAAKTSATQNMEALAQLKRTTVSARSLEQALVAIPDGIIVTDSDDIVVSANPAARTLLGCAVNPHGQHVRRLMHQDAPSLPAGTYMASLRPSQSMLCSRVLDVQARDDAAWPVEISSSSIDGVGALGNGRVITLHSEGERDRETRLRGEFVSVVSHELRTPLTTILGGLKLITGGMCGPVSPSSAAIVQLAERNAIRLAQLIEDILDIEAIETGNLRLACTRTDLAALLERSVQTLRPFADMQGVALELVLPTQARPIAQAPLTPLDPHRIEQVLANLVSNAIKFSPAGGQVTIRLTSTSGAWRVAVEDRGKGVADAFVPRLFERFAQDTENPGAMKGTGLGLAISKAIAEQHGGALHHAHTPGGGATFTLELPHTGGAKCAAAHG